MALALMGMAVVALMELYSTSLRGVRRAADHGVAVIYARSMIEGALAARDVRGYEPPALADQKYKGRLTVDKAPSAEGELVSTYQLTAEVQWDKQHVVTLSAKKVQYDQDVP